jgi:tetratricopeptide (TPR) repeat protein
MNAAQAFQRVVNAPGPTALLAAAGVAFALIVIACGVLSTGKRRWLAAGLGALGLVTVVAVLVLVDIQTVRSRTSESVTVTRSRYSEGRRRAARAALVALPVVLLAASLAVLASQRRLLRARVPRLLKSGRKYLLKKDYEAALAEYNRALQISPYLGEAYCGRGCVYHAMGNTAEALAEFDRAIQIDPRLPSAYVERAKVRTESGELDGALADLEQLMIIRPNDPELFLNRGICLLKKGQVKDALADFRRVLKLTNHTDFAEPAKNYLRELEAQVELPPAVADSNGAPAVAAPSQPRPATMHQPQSDEYVL